MRELHCPTKTEQKLALGGWHSANALALLFSKSIAYIVTLWITTATNDETMNVKILIQLVLAVKIFKGHSVS